MIRIYRQICVIKTHAYILHASFKPISYCSEEALDTHINTTVGIDDYLYSFTTKYQKPEFSYRYVYFTCIICIVTVQNYLFKFS